MFIKYLKTFLIAMLPIIELRGALPIALIKYNLNPYGAYLISIIGNIIVVPFILIFIDSILKFLSKTKLKKLAEWITKKGDKAKNKIINHEKGVYIALMLFVAIPLPGTGAWTGSLAASFLKLDKKKSFLYISLGVLLAGIIIFSLSKLGLMIIK